MKIGDYVTCVDNSPAIKIDGAPNAPLTIGKVYKILDVVEVGSNDIRERLAIKIICDLNLESNYYTYRFSLSDRRKNIIDDLL